MLDQHDLLSSVMSLALSGFLRGRPQSVTIVNFQDMAWAVERRRQVVAAAVMDDGEASDIMINHLMHTNGSLTMRGEQPPPMHDHQKYFLARIWNARAYTESLQRALTLGKGFKRKIKRDRYLEKGYEE